MSSLCICWITWSSDDWGWGLVSGLLIKRTLGIQPEVLRDILIKKLLEVFHTGVLSLWRKMKVFLSERCKWSNKIVEGTGICLNINRRFYQTQNKNGDTELRHIFLTEGTNMPRESKNGRWHKTGLLGLLHPCLIQLAWACLYWQKKGNSSK